MSAALQPEATLRARVDSRPRLSPIWLVPIIAMLIAGWLVWDAMAKRGPLITVTFQSAEGLQAGESHLRYLEVDIGLVESITLNPNMAGVSVTIRTTREAEPLLTENAQIWVVRPRLFAGNISGLSTLVSGSYVELMPATAGGQRRLSFTGLEDPPVRQARVPGRTLKLQASRIGSLSVGSPIFFRDLSVGQVLGWEVGKMAEDVTIHAFVRAPFEQYHRENSHFWNASGVSLQLGAEGVHLQLELLKALILGGIAFDTPAESRAAAGTEVPDSFVLFASQQAAKDAGYRRRVKYLAYFEGSVSGLSVGAPVTFQGLRVGEVTSVQLEYDATSDMLRVPVHFDVQPERIADVRLAEARSPLENARMRWHAACGRSCRARTYSPARCRSRGDRPRCGTGRIGRRGRCDGSADRARANRRSHGRGDPLLAKVEKMPFDRIGESLEATLQGVSQTVNSPELKQSLAALQATLQSTQDMVKRLDQGMAPALQQLPAVVTNLQGTLTQANRLLASTDRGYGDGSRFNRDLERLMLN